MAGKKGSTWSKPMTKQQRDEIALTKIEKMLDDQRDGVVELSAIQIKALEIRYHKLRPSLSAVEQTTINPADKINEAQRMNNLLAFCRANPDFLPTLQARLNTPLDVGNGAVLSPDTPITQTTH